MTNNLMQVFLGFQTLDELGRTKLLGVCTTNDVAATLVEGKGYYGGNGTVEGPYNVYTSIDDFESNKLTEARKSALDKLTTLEKTALGLPNE